MLVESTAARRKDKTLTPALAPLSNDDPGFVVMEKPNWDGNENVEEPGNYGKEFCRVEDVGNLF